MLTIMLTFVLPFIFCILIWMLIRNEQVYTFRNKIIEEDYQNGIKAISENKYHEFERRYGIMPSYDTMVYSFWVLDFNRFLDPEDDTSFEAFTKKVWKFIKGK